MCMGVHIYIYKSDAMITFEVFLTTTIEIMISDP